MQSGFPQHKDIEQQEQSERNYANTQDDMDYKDDDFMIRSENDVDISHSNNHDDFPEVEEEFASVRSCDDNNNNKASSSFASGFFQFVVATKNNNKSESETLENQKRRQMEVFKTNLTSIDPDLKDVVDCQIETQNALVEKTKQLEEIKSSRNQQIQYISQNKTTTLEEEKQKQMELLKLNLQSIDPDLKDVMDCQIETQQEIIARKKQEMEQVRAAINEKLKELDSSAKASSSKEGNQSSSPSSSSIWTSWMTSPTRSKTTSNENSTNEPKQQQEADREAPTRRSMRSSLERMISWKATK